MWGGGQAIVPAEKQNPSNDMFVFLSLFVFFPPPLCFRPRSLFLLVAEVNERRVKRERGDTEEHRQSGR